MVRPSQPHPAQKNIFVNIIETFAPLALFLLPLLAARQHVLQAASDARDLERSHPPEIVWIGYLQKKSADKLIGGGRWQERGHVDDEVAR